MTDREKLVELLEATTYEALGGNLVAKGFATAKEFADHLIANGVTVRECQIVAKLEQELAVVRRERNAAVSVVKDCCGCEKCDHYTGTEEHIEAICLSCEGKCHFEMRGMKGLPVTPEDFLVKVENLYDNGRDPEVFHDETDTLMEDILIAFGYQKGIEFLRSKVRWSA